MNPATSTAGALVPVPGDRFFVQLVALDPAAPAAAQVELALEETSPFPLPQLYHGFVTGRDRTQALAFAAYRRRLPAEEQGGWESAAAVLPDFLALLAPVPGEPAVTVHVADGRATVVAWDGRHDLPAAVLARAVPDATDAVLADLVAEVRESAGLAEAPVRHLSGPLELRRDDAGDLLGRVGGAETLRLPAAALAAADVRDKVFLEDKARRERQDRRWWTLSLAAGGLLLLAVGLEAANLGLGLWNSRVRAAVAQHAGDVRRIEAAQTMAIRVEQLSAREQRPLEWLGTVAAVRPRSVQFTRVISRHGRALEVEAQTPSANDVGNFEAALRGVPGIERAETRDLRAREGVTSFVVALTFKPGPAGRAEGRP